MHLQPVYRDQPMCGGAVSERLFETGLCLPSGSTLSADDQRRVIDLVLSAGAGDAVASQVPAHA
jgi:dTDP-4-amino-4,6-dideoxygalactose transaminase